MTTLETLEHQFLEQLVPLQGSWPWHEQAWQRLLQQGLPDKNTEAYRYVHLRQLYQTQFVPLDALLPAHIPSSITLLPLHEAYLHFRSYLDKQIASWFTHERDPFAWVGAALAKQGLFLYVPPGVNISLELIAPAQLFIYVGRGATCTVHLHSTAALGWYHRKVDAQVEGTLKLQFEPHTSSAIHLDTVRVDVKREGQFVGMAHPSSAPLSRQDYHVRLMGERADAKLYGLIRGSESQQHHVYVSMEHIAPHTTSRQQFKAVLHDRARHSFEGKIYVHAEAQKTDAYQMHRALLLSPRAESRCKPNLEIFADDVKASHGASCGQLDAEALFYLAARGIPASQAKQMLIDAFCAEVLSGL